MQTAKSTESTVSATEHYNRLLAEHYSWMAGSATAESFAAKVRQQRELLGRLGVRASALDPGNGQALDLGCGSGFQTMALAELGFSVVAIDSSVKLLEELRIRAAGMIVAGTVRPGAVTIVEHDLADLAACPGLPSAVDVAVCMGDTLSHLPSKAAVSGMFAQVAKRLAPGGFLVVGYRDLSAPAEGLNRFIPVRSDENRVMTCFLDYRQDEPESVAVTDLIYQRADGQPAGQQAGQPAAGGNDAPTWTFSKSAYRKLRLARDWVKTELVGCGLEVEHDETTQGMITLVARRNA